MRHKANSSVYQEYYHNSKMNAVVQDAFLGRGTQSPYLAIFNHMGLRLDEDAPKRVPDEMMRAIGPNTAVRRLEEEMEALQAKLKQKYGRPTWATEDEKKHYNSIKSQLSTARQKQRRKVFRMLYRDHFVENDECELQKQLQGIHEPMVERQITHSLPQRRILAEILGDMDEDLPEEDIVSRKVEAINAMVAYAFVVEPLQRTQPEPRTMPVPTSLSEVVLPTLPEQPVALNVTEPTQSTPRLLVLELSSDAPPPPYSEFDSRAWNCLPMSARETVTIPGRRRSPFARKRPDPCIFCGKKYTRTDALWDHLEGHLELAKGGPLACPRKECEGMMFQNPERFKAHAARFHGSSFRVRIKLVTSRCKESPGGCAGISPKPKIILVPSENKARSPGLNPALTSPRPRIILVGSKIKVANPR